jgi:polar amino acid transport system substrate-binding protein
MHLRRFFVSIAFSVAAASPAFGLTLLTEENPPLNFTHKGELVGLAVGVVKEMVKRSALPAEIRAVQWNEAFERAQSDPTVCAFSTARLPARSALFKWIGPITRGYWSAFALEGFEGYLPNVDHLKAYRIGVVADARARYLRQRGFTKLVEVEKDIQNPGKLTLDLARADGIDLWVTQGFMAADVARRAGVGPVKEVFPAIMSQEYWLACHLQMDPQTLRGLSEAIDAMRKDGTYRKLNDTRSLPAPN